VKGTKDQSTTASPSARTNVLPMDSAHLPINVVANRVTVDPSASPFVHWVVERTSFASCPRCAAVKVATMGKIAFPFALVDVEIIASVRSPVNASANLFIKHWETAQTAGQFARRNVVQTRPARSRICAPA